MRIASYNIFHGGMVELNMDVLGADLAALGADIAGLQEVDQNVKRSAFQDTVAKISAAAGLPHTGFARGIFIGDGEYGTAVFSRFAVSDFSVTALRSGSAEQRSLGHAVITLDGREVHFINTHLSLGDRTKREEQFRQIAAQLPADAPWIITGDFNTEDFTEFDVLGGTLTNCAERKFLSYYPGGRAIDNIVLSRHWKITAAGMVESTHSDHNMIWCDAELCE